MELLRRSRKLKESLEDMHPKMAKTKMRLRSKARQIMNRNRKKNLSMELGKFVLWQQFQRTKDTSCSPNGRDMTNYRGYEYP